MGGAASSVKKGLYGNEMEKLLFKCWRLSNGTREHLENAYNDNWFWDIEGHLNLYGK